MSPRPAWHPLGAALLALALAGCGKLALDARAEPAGTAARSDAAWLRCKPQTTHRLYFGAQMPDGEVDDVAWQRFVADAVAPRFADGFTVIEARGQWRGPDGAVVGERTRVLEIVAPDDAAVRQSLIELVATYKARFRQQAVLVTQVPVRACL